MDMALRAPAAEAFYRGDAAAQVRAFLEGFTPPARSTPVTAAAVPHAGWMYSGRIAARVFACIRHAGPPRTLVLLGAVHRWCVRRAALDPSPAWWTPAGALPLDEALATTVAEQARDWVEVDAAPNAEEHSLEVQAPLLRYLMPDAKIVPILVPPSPDAPLLGARLAEILPPGVPVVASTDLTHYGATYGHAPAGEGEAGCRWMEERDRALIARALDMDADGVLDEAIHFRSACGAGALAAAIAFARARGVARGELLTYATSRDVSREPHFQVAVGYAGMLW